MSAPWPRRKEATSIEQAKWSGVWPSPPRAETTLGSAATNSLSSLSIPKRAAA